ncbi:MAG: N-acetyl-gamma-glutamyl-phosphate reductase [Deltaproteobacteria bacterium]|nr:N-acetyl-gamma-glutamyl-phosphate reductase [Deltaproteobacteria bacterium]
MVHARVALFGAAGYSGVELLKLLALHPGVELVAAASDSQAGKPLSDLTGAGAGPGSFVRTDEALLIPADLALLAVPPDAAATLAPQLRAKGTKIIDLSHAFRAATGKTGEAVYGLTSLFADQIAGATIVANPGCYATCVITAVAPLVRHQLIERDVIVAAGSGVTGAGRTGEEAMSLGELHGNVRAYKVLRHQHVPEIEMALGRVASGSSSTTPRVILTTHLLPIARGIFATITVKLRRPVSSAELTDRLRADYADDPTIVVAATPEDVSLRKIVGTNQCHVGIAAVGDIAVVTAALDNLLKGAAGQAVENMNLVLGLPRMTGLTHLARHG